VRTWLWRLRQRYRKALRMEVASTVSDPANVDQELRYLHQILTARALNLKLRNANHQASERRAHADVRSHSKEV
jgi:hypothetical protein